MVTLRFTEILILCTEATPTIKFFPYLSPIDHKQRRVCRYLYLQPILASMSRSSCAALSSQASIIVASRSAPVTIIAAHYRSLDGLGSATHLFTLLFSFRASPLGEETPRKNPRAKKSIIMECKQNFREGAYA